MTKKIVIKMTLADKKYSLLVDWLKDIGYSDPCKFFIDLIKEGGIELGYWIIFPEEDIKIECEVK